MNKLYSTGCPNCKILEKKLQQKGIDFEISSDVDAVIKMGFKTVPVLQVDCEYYNFSEAVAWVNKQENK